MTGSLELSRIEVMGEVWQVDRHERTRTGRLIEAAKDHGDEAAGALLATDVAEWVRDLVHPGPAIVVPVPPSPDRPNRLVPVIADAVGAAWSLPVIPALERDVATPRLRDLAPELRADAAAAAAYRVAGSVDGRQVVLVDDVVLTTTTLAHLARVLGAAGADGVSALVVARSRRG